MDEHQTKQAAAEAELLTSRARRAARRPHELDKAVAYQQRAVTLYRQVLDSVTEVSEGPEIRSAAHKASDAHGRLGGLFRRSGRLTDAVKQYGEGKEIEERYDLAESYCLGNWIAVQVIDDAGRLAALADEIEVAIARVERQVNGERRNQWWAWADLGMLSLLAGRSTEADRAYNRFAITGARPVDYRSTIDVLEELGQALETIGSSQAKLFGPAIRRLETHMGTIDR